MDKAIDNLLTRAEECFNKGQTRMARLALSAAVQRLGDETDWSDELVTRINHLDEMIGDGNVPADVIKCPDCNGTRHYRPGLPCFACGGKGYQNARDRAKQRQFWQQRALEEASKPPKTF